MAKKRKKKRSVSPARRKKASPRGPRTTHRRKRKPAAKKNARARRNPRRRVIGDAAVALSYEGGEGKRKGKLRGPWEHEFERGDVQIIGMEDGTILLESKSGVPLWGEFEV